MDGPFKCTPRFTGSLPTERTRCGIELWSQLPRVSNLTGSAA